MKLHTLCVLLPVLLCGGCVAVPTIMTNPRPIPATPAPTTIPRIQPTGAPTRMLRPLGRTPTPGLLFPFPTGTAAIPITAAATIGIHATGPVGTDHQSAAFQALTLSPTGRTTAPCNDRRDVLPAA